MKIKKFYFKTVTSTNDIAIKKINEGIHSGLIVAKKQTKGRGRYGNKWIYLKNNPIGMETIAFKGHEDSPKVIKFIKDYADYEKMYEKALEKKIAMFYERLMWSLPMDKSSTIEKFF